MRSHGVEADGVTCTATHGALAIGRQWQHAIEQAWGLKPTISAVEKRWQWRCALASVAAMRGG